MIEHKWTVYFKEDGQTWTIEVDPFWAKENPEEFKERPEYVYFREVGHAHIECDKDKNIIFKD